MTATTTPNPTATPTPPPATAPTTTPTADPLEFRRTYPRPGDSRRSTIHAVRWGGRAIGSLVMAAGGPDLPPDGVAWAFAGTGGHAGVIVTGDLPAGGLAPTAAVTAAILARLGRTYAGPGPAFSVTAPAAPPPVTP